MMERAEPLINREYLERAVEKAREKLARDAISMDEFVEDYGKDSVARDKEYVADRERKFAESDSETDKERKEFADIIEAIINEQIELSDWFGEGVWMRKTTPFDDIVHSVDTIAEIHREEGVRFLGLAIDVTFSGGAIRNNLVRSRNEIEKGTLAEAKYFIDSEGTFRGRLRKIPRVVIGADPSTIKELAGLWINGKKKELAEHPFQIDLIEEVIFQLETFKSYAESLEGDRSDIISIYDNHIKIFKQILARKSEIKFRRDEGEGREDNVHRVIREAVGQFKYL